MVSTKESGLYRVLKVIDGDTFQINLNRNKKIDGEEKIKLYDVDTFVSKDNRVSTSKEIINSNFNSNKYHKLHCKYAKCKSCKTCHRPDKSHNQDNTKKQSSYKSKDKSKKTYKKQKPTIKPLITTPEKLIPDEKTENIELYFIDPIKYRLPANFARTAAAQALLREINNAEESIYFAIYGIDKQPEIFDALIKRKSEGIDIKWVTDKTEHGENIYPDTNLLIEKLGNVVTDYGYYKDKNLSNYKYKLTYQSAFMHNKFFIFDKSRIWTGSTNISSTGIGGYNSNVGILINSKPIANLYLEEFNQMYKQQFHLNKNLISNNENIKVNEETTVSVYFSPKHKNVIQKINFLINKAQNYIYIPIFYLTHNDFVENLIAASKRGVDVKIILDATCAKGSYSKHKYLRSEGVKVKVENFAGKMHMKTGIIDDKYLIIGSMNWTKRSSHKNDENTLIIQNPKLTKSYKKHFLHLWNYIPDKFLNIDPMPESPDSIGSCSDGIDNDHDEYIDMYDLGCSKNQR